MGKQEDMSNRDYRILYNMFKNKINALESRLETAEIELLSINSVIDFFIDATPQHGDYQKTLYDKDDEDDPINTYTPKELPPAKQVPIRFPIMGLDFSDNIRNKKVKKRGRK